jgi:hypothetical protein
MTRARGKPRRALWELQNRHNRYWGRPLKLEPEDGFAEENRPPEFFNDVVIWFRDAMPERCRTQRIPVPEIERIARLLKEFREMAGRPRDAQMGVSLDKTHALQKKFADFKKALGNFLDLCPPSDRRIDHSVIPLVNLLEAARLAEPHIGMPQKPGPPVPIWHIWATNFEEPIRLVLKKAGAPFSKKADGPLVKVISSALVAIDGKERKQDAIEACLKRARLKRGAE